MITVKKLKELLNKLPDDAKCYAYEGERVGIGIYNEGKDVYEAVNVWWIDACEDAKEETYTEGFTKENKDESIKH